MDDLSVHLAAQDQPAHNPSCRQGAVSRLFLGTRSDLAAVAQLALVDRGHLVFLKIQGDLLVSIHGREHRVPIDQRAINADRNYEGDSGFLEPAIPLGLSLDVVADRANTGLP